MPSTIEVLMKSLPAALGERMELTDQLWPGDPRGAIDSFLRQGDVPVSIISTLQFTKSLLFYTEDDDYLCGGILTLLKNHTFEELGRLLFPFFKNDGSLSSTSADVVSGLTVESLDKVRSKFLDNQPLAILLVMVRAKVFPFDKRKQRIVECALTAMEGCDLEIGSSEMSAAVKKSFSQNSTGDKQAPEEQQPKNEELKQASEFITSVKVLLGLVDSPEDVPRLYEQGYRTVRSIRVKKKADFEDQMVRAEMKRDNALRVHDCAECVDCWNENLWLSLMKDRREEFVMVEAKVGSDDESDDEKYLTPPSKNNLTEIFRLEDTACEECCSVTSLSAYYADLLLLFSDISPTGEDLTKHKNLKSRDSLFKLLSNRRPDLRKLELTCANAQTLVPYVSLVNEVLESFVRYKNKAKLSTPSPSGQQDLVNVFNTPVSTEQDSQAGHSGEPVYHQGNTDYEVYSKIISKQMFPFGSLPYDQARDQVIQYLASFQLHLLEFVETFQAPELILQKIPMEKRENLPEALKQSLIRGTDEVLERQSAAETLGLQQVEFVAITGETFFPEWFADILRGSSNGDMDIATEMPEGEWCTLWGYENENTMLDNTKELGLSFIKRQLMQRSGLEFQDILDLVKTQYFGQYLVITNASQSNEFTESLEDLRLLCSSSQPPFKPLTPNIGRNLQAFMRLQAKLKWPIKDLDAAIYCLRNKEMEMSPTFKATDMSEIPPLSTYLLKNIAYIVRLSELCGIEPAYLLPLWGPIDSFGDNSLLHRKFLHPSWGKAFKIPEDGQYFKDGGAEVLIQSCAASISASLGWPLELLEDLLRATGLTDAYLDVDTFSTLYRYITIAQMLEVPPTESLSFFQVFFADRQEDPLASPKATLSAIKSWKVLLNSGWTIKSLVSVLGKTFLEVDDERAQNSGLQLLAPLLGGARDIKNSLSSIMNGNNSTSENVTECAARTFDPATAKMVVEFVEGTQVHRDTVKLDSKESLEKLLQMSEKWTNKLSVVPVIDGIVFSAELKLSGILSTAEQEQIDEHSKLIPSLQFFLQSFIHKSLLPRSIIRSRFGETSKSNEKLSGNVLLGDWPTSQPAEETKSQKAETGKKSAGNNSSQNSSTEAQILAEGQIQAEAQIQERAQIQAEAQIQERRAAFIDLATPTIIQDLLRTLIINAIKDLVPDIDASLLVPLVSGIIKVPTIDNKGTESVMLALQYLSEHGDNMVDTDTVDGYFAPTTTDEFTLAYTGFFNPSPAVKSPSLSINGLEIPFDRLSKKWRALRMTSGHRYLLEGKFPLSQLTWSTSRTAPAVFTNQTLLPSTATRRAALIINAISRVASICQTLKLTTAELDYIDLQVQMGGNILAIDLSAPTLKNLVQLQNYCELRRKSNNMNENGSSNMVNLFSWLSNTSTASAKELAAKIAMVAGWNEKLVEHALTAKFPGHTGDRMAKALCSFDALFSLKAIVDFAERLGDGPELASQPLMMDLFELAKPLPQLNVEEHYAKTAQSLQSRLAPSQRAASDERLMNTRRKALIAYLLQQKYIKNDLHISDADGLFEYFLIDVQMGPQLRTSRIKQAISVVQLFAQRCLLGLEKGVSKAVLPRERWDWMQQYTLWEAHRKLFLYPENWIDPTLRDDKSQLFDQFEAELMQKDLSINTFLQAIQTYVYGLNEISSLEIVAYLHEPQPQQADIFHFFGRTRAAPYNFYYRSVSILRSGNDIFWRPWAKIEMDIPSVETGWGGQRLESTGAYLFPTIISGRLYLFMPSISPKTLVSDVKVAADSGPSFEDRGKEKIAKDAPTHIWEMTMGWTEFVKGSWSPKRISPGGLSVDSFVSSSQFRIDPTFSENNLTMTIRFSTAGSRACTTIGSFVFCEDQIRAIALGTTSSFTSQFPTYFQKATGKDFEPSTLLTDGKYRNENALLWVPSDIHNNKNDITWTLSKMPQRVTGLVLSVKQSNNTTISYFNLPKTELLRAKGDEWDEHTVANDMELVVLDHTLSNQLMQATADRVDPLHQLYKTIAQLPFVELRESFGAGSGLAWYHELGRPSAIYNWEIGLHAVLLAVDRFFSTQQFDEALQVARLVFDPSADLDVETMIPRRKDADKKGSDKKDGKKKDGKKKDVDKKDVDKKERGKKVSDKKDNIQEEEEKIRFKSCWRFPPFQDMARKMARKGESSFDPLDLNNLKTDIKLAMKERRSYGQLVHAAARGRPVSYMKWIVMKYAEILIASGDVYFRRGTLESLPLAIQRYAEATHILGPAPPKIPDLAKRKRKAMTFEQLREEDIKFDSVLFDLGLPFSAKLRAKGQEKGAAVKVETDSKKENMACFLRTDYFCVPMNPRFKEMRTLIHERLFNIRNSLDIQGRPVTYALREPPIDPGDLIALSKQGLSVSDDVLNMVQFEQESPLPRQRFELLLSRSLDLCAELRSLGERLLSAIEKKEGEKFNVLRSRHTTVIQQMMFDIKQIQLDEAQQTVESLLINRSSQESQLGFYLELIGEKESKIPKPKDTWVDLKQDIEVPTRDDLRISSYEKAEMDLATASSLINVVASGIDGLIAPVFAVPQIETYTAPLGVGVSMSVGGNQIVGGMSSASNALKMAAMVIADQGSRAGRKAQLSRQLQERRLQANMHGREIKSIDKQVEIQQIRIRAVKKEIDQQKSELDEAVQVEEWYRTKYTNEQLYAWIEKGLRNVYYQAYTLAMTMARRAESALAFERGRKVSIIRPGGYWDTSREGLFAADHLYLDLKRLEALQLEGSPADYEISKTISLRQIDPMALMRFRITGATEVSLGELLYDLDFPGQYMRRIRSVAISIPAVLGPHSGINATLTLQKHRYRVSPTVSGAADYIASQATGSQAFRSDRIPISSVAVSSGSADSGIFELNFSGPRYMPFEGAGAISTWRLELPTVIRKFDYESISDVLLHVQYTAHDGGATLKAAANGAVLQAARAVEVEGQNTGFWAIWDLKNEFVNQWYSFSTKLAGRKTSGGDDISMKLGNLKDRLPFWSRRQEALQVREVTFISKSQSLVSKLEIPALVSKSTWQPGNIGSFFKRSCTATANNLDWVITAKTAVEQEGKPVENVYLLIHYVFAGTKII